MIARAGVFFGRHASARPKWYVDSVNGSDANSGTAPESALRTIAALAPRIQAGDRIGLARGSHWREQLYANADGVQVLAYGSGAKPVLDASDVIAAASWTKTSGYTSIYQCTVPVESSGFVSIWENNTRLKRATAMADLDTTEGRYLPLADPTGAGNVTIYVHATGGANPKSNGKTYEYARRAYGFYTDRTRCKVQGIETRRNLGNNGSLEVGPYCSIIDCLASEGTKHNLLVHRGCSVTNTEAANSYYAGQSKVLMVWNEDSPNGEDITFVNCYAHDEFEQTAVAFYGHTNVSGAFGRITLNGCRAEHVQSAFAAVGDCSEVMIEGCDLWVLSCMVKTTISNSTIRGNFRCISMAGNPAVTLRNSTILGNYSTVDGADALIYSPYPGATLDIQGTRMEGTAKDGINQAPNGIWMDGPNASLISRSNVFANLSHYYLIGAEGYTIDSDYNQFLAPYSDTQFRMPGWQWKTLEQWKADTGEDLHSTP